MTYLSFVKQSIACWGSLASGSGAESRDWELAEASEG